MGNHRATGSDAEANNARMPATGLPATAKRLRRRTSCRGDRRSAPSSDQARRRELLRKPSASASLLRLRARRVVRIYGCRVNLGCARVCSILRRYGR